MNGLAVDSDSSTLYTGGRDGVICAWDLNVDLKTSSLPDYDTKLPAPTATTYKQQVQAHTHWINDICLAQSNQALVSASSDITVKVWRPAATGGTPPQTVGLHSDYVKVLAVPSQTSDWVASGGLDRKINLWDLNGSGQKLSIDVGEDESGGMGSKEKGSVYALAANENTVASGGPESIVRVWDTRSAKRTTKLVGHTDNIRDVLLSQDGTTILTASSDRTVKVWSTVAGRCMFTLTPHDASVWCLFSSDPDLSVFYSSDKNGLIAKTDTRDTIELDDGISVAIAQEAEGVHKLVQAGDCIWTATSRPSINRWKDVETNGAEMEIPEGYTSQQESVAKMRYPSVSNQAEFVSSSRTRSSPRKRKIPMKHMLKLSNTAFWPTPITANGDNRGSIVERPESPPEDGDASIVMQPIRAQPELSVHGQNGIIKHVMLNDRKRVLTLDTAGEVVMWDLLKCVPIKSYGKRDLDDVRDETVTAATVSNWCSVDTRTGSVAVILEENTCFDAEMYADELDLDEDIEFKDDQRINLGKWVLRYLFSNLISVEIERDDVFRKQLMGTIEERKARRENAPSSIQMPEMQVNGWHASGPESASTPRATSGTKPTTPGLNIGLATPGSVGLNSPAKASAGASAMSPTIAEDSTNLEKQKPQARTSSDRHSDYFSKTKMADAELVSPSGITAKTPVTPSEGTTEEKEPSTPVGEHGSTPKDTPTGKEAGLFGKKFSMRGMGFASMKKMTSRTEKPEKEKPAAVEEKDESTDHSDSHSSKTSNSRNVDDNFFGSVQKIRFGYEDSMQQQIQTQQAHENGLPVPAISTIDVPCGITPSLPAETPVLKPPPSTTILIQEDRPEAGGVADLFEGTVGSLGTMADTLERTAPMWLGEVLLRNQIPQKDVVKISFVLEPMAGSGLVGIASDGNNRLNANRMLRAKKILGYVAERIEPGPEEGEERGRAEEYLELWCLGQVSTFISSSLYAVAVLIYILTGRRSHNDPRHHPLPPLARRRRYRALLQGQRQAPDQARCAANYAGDSGFAQAGEWK